jgi:hypothetical protein
LIGRRNELGIGIYAVNIVAQVLSRAPGIDPCPGRTPFPDALGKSNAVIVKRVAPRAKVKGPLKTIEDVVFDRKIWRRQVKVVLKESGGLTVGNLRDEGVVIKLVMTAAIRVVP